MCDNNVLRLQRIKKCNQNFFLAIAQLHAQYEIEKLNRAVEREQAAIDIFYSSGLLLGMSCLRTLESCP